ncbi:MAG: radical SAM protein [Thermoguttaceae bacterium]
MVKTLAGVRLLNRLPAFLKQDLQGWWRNVRSRWPLRPGLYTYKFHPPGGKRRVQLRIESDGAGVLFIDAMDAIRLNPSAAALAKFALDGFSVQQAAAAIGCCFAGINKAEIQQHADEIFALVRHLAATTDPCPTCGLRTLEKAPLFSVPVAAPYKADLALTYGCNNACAHCYNRVESRLPENRSEQISLLQWKAVLEKLANIGIPHVIFTGGEPTLFPDLAELIFYAEKIGLITGLNTNGRKLADRDFVDSLVRAGISHVQITLQSYRAEVHNAISAAAAFDETLEGISNCIAAGLHTITNTTLTRRNMGDALEIVDFLHNLGLRTFAMNGMIFSGHGLHCGDAVAVEQLHCVLAAVRDRAAELNMKFLWYTPTDYCRLSPVELELGPRRCNAGEYSICIEPNGDVLPCQSYYCAAGNILRDPWRRIWQSDLFRSFRRRIVDPRGGGLPEKCWQCPDLTLCGGGCRLERQVSGQWTVGGM